MSYSNLVNAHNESAHSIYVHALSNAYLGGHRIYDPGYSIHRDYEAYDKLRQDAVINHAITYRKHLVAGRNVQMVPASDAELDVRAAAVMEDAVDRIPNFSRVRFSLAEGVVRGSDWEFMGGEVLQLPLGDGAPRPWWIPTRIQNMNRLRVVAEPVETDDGRVYLKHKVWNLVKRDWDDLSHPEWYIKHVYDDVEESLGFGRGLIDALYFPWWAKTILFNEGLGAAERWGRGMLVAKIDGTIPAGKTTSNSIFLTKFITELEKMQARNIFAIDKRHEIEVVHPDGTGHAIITDLINYCDTTMRTLILGSNVTGSDEGGSYARDVVRENSTEALVQYDRDLMAETLTKDMVGLVWKINKANLAQLGLDGAQMPKLTIMQEKIADPVREAQIAATVTPFAPLPKKVFYEKIGYPMPEEGEETVGGAPSMVPPVPGVGPEKEPAELLEELKAITGQSSAAVGRG